MPADDAHPARLPLALVVAVARNGVIGNDNQLPWSLPSDLRHFRALTMGQPVVMGRRTFESIGRPLPGRFLVVLSGDPAFAPTGVEVARSIEAGLDSAARIGRERNARAVLVAGGGTLYATLIARADRLYVTEVDVAPVGDVRFPVIDAAQWRETRRVPGERTPRDEADFTFLTYERTPNATA